MKTILLLGGKEAPEGVRVGEKYYERHHGEVYYRRGARVYDLMFEGAGGMERAKYTYNTALEEWSNHGHRACENFLANRASYDWRRDGRGRNE